MDQGGNNATQTGWRTISNTTFKQDIDNASSKIRNSEEFQDCMKKQANMCIQTTGMQIAQKNKDSAFCKELPNADEQLSCEFAITMINAQEANNEKLCDTLKTPTYLKQCKVHVYKQNAIAKNDISLCEKIATVINTTDTEFTSEASMQKDQCILQFISSNASAKESDCKKLSNIASEDMCKTILKSKTQIINPPTPGNIPLIKR